MGSPSTVDVAATGTKEFPLGGVGRTPPASSLQEELAENHGSGKQKASQKQKLFHGCPSTLLKVPFHTPPSIAHASDTEPWEALAHMVESGCFSNPLCSGKS